MQVSTKGKYSIEHMGTALRVLYSQTGPSYFSLYPILAVLFYIHIKMNTHYILETLLST